MGDNHDKLKHVAGRGTLAEIAYREVLGEHLLRMRENSINEILQTFAEGKHGTELISAVAELRAYDRLGKSLLSQIKQGKLADKKLEGIYELSGTGQNEIGSETGIETTNRDAQYGYEGL